MTAPRSSSLSLKGPIPDLGQLLADPAAYLKQREVTIGSSRPYRTILTCVILFVAFAALLPLGVGPPSLILGGMGIMLIATVYLLWPTRREVVLHPSGIEFIHGASTVWCPWDLFNSPGHSLVVSGEDTAPQLLVPIAATAAFRVEHRRHGALVTTGSEVRSSAFRFQSPREVLLTVHYRVSALELGELLLHLGRRLGAAEVADAEILTGYEVVKEPRAQPQRDRRGWLTVPITQLQFLPYCAVCGMPTAETYAWTAPANLNAKDLGVNILLAHVGGSFERNFTFPLPFCRRCRVRYRWRYVGASVMIAFFALCLMPALARQSLGVVEIMLGGIGFVFAMIGFHLANHFPVRAAYDVTKQTIAFQFDDPAAGEKMLGVG